MNADFFILQQTPGYFANRNDGAEWLQSHKEDPYWMGHQLANAAGDNKNFEEYWQMAREIKGYSNAS